MYPLNDEVEDQCSYEGGACYAEATDEKGGHCVPRLTLLRALEQST